MKWCFHFFCKLLLHGKKYYYAPTGYNTASTLNMFTEWKEVGLQWFIWINVSEVKNCYDDINCMCTVHYNVNFSSCVSALFKTDKIYKSKNSNSHHVSCKSNRKSFVALRWLSYMLYIWLAGLFMYCNCIYFFFFTVSTFCDWNK